MAVTPRPPQAPSQDASVTGAVWARNRRRVTIRSSALRGAGWSGRPERFFEQAERALPGELGGAVVVTGGRVVGEAVLRAGVLVDLELDLGRREGGFIGGPRGVDALVLIREVH